jgi:hypothetical protein
MFLARMLLISDMHRLRWRGAAALILLHGTVITRYGFRRVLSRGGQEATDVARPRDYQFTDGQAPMNVETAGVVWGDITRTPEW